MVEGFDGCLCTWIKIHGVPAFGVKYLFECKPLRNWLINGGYNLAVFAAMGAIIGAL